jgi:FtsH-binding integral membrane protein
MQPNVNRGDYVSPTASLAVSQYMSKVYLWMTAGILLTGLVAWGVGNNEEFMYTLMANKILFFGLIIAEFGLVIWLSARINKMSFGVASGMFMTYAALNGITLSVFSMIYTAESVQSAFFTTTAAFAGLSGFGYVTKRDLGPVGSFCTMGLFGLIGFGLLAMFFPSMMGSTASKIYGLAGIVIFAGLTAYDTQKIKNMAYGHGNGAIMGALKLYLDFINLFLFILRMTGRRR